MPTILGGGRIDFSTMIGIVVTSVLVLVSGAIAVAALLAASRLSRARG